MRIHHYNDLTTGPCHYYTSAVTGRRLLFRESEIAGTRFGQRDTAFVVTQSGAEFRVTSYKPEQIIDE